MSYLTEFKSLVGDRETGARLHEKTGTADPSFVQKFKKMMAKGDRALSAEDWYETMKLALVTEYPDTDYTYNEFDLEKVAKALRSVPGIRIVPAREYSPAIYVSGPPEALGKLEKMAKKLRADEVDYQDDGTLRLWWD